MHERVRDPPLRGALYGPVAPSAGPFFVSERELLCGCDVRLMRPVRRTQGSAASGPGVDQALGPCCVSGSAES